MSALLRPSLCCLALALLASCAEQALWAGTCGDYLQHPSAPTAPAKATGGESHLHFPLAPKRCNGPRCSQAPIGPISTPTVPPSAPSETRQLVAILDREMDLEAGSSRWAQSTAAPYLYIALEEIFHPPRFSHS